MAGFSQGTESGRSGAVLAGLPDVATVVPPDWVLFGAAAGHPWNRPGGRAAGFQERPATRRGANVGGRTGIVSAGAVVLGIVFFRESSDLFRSSR